MTGKPIPFVRCRDRGSGCTYSVRICHSVEFTIGFANSPANPVMPHNKAYRRVEKKIEQARKEKATELDLSFMNLTELPDSLGQFKQLRVLAVYRNRLGGCLRSSSE
jgi:hypothetical protein